MMRIDRARFDASRFPVSIEIPTRWDDLDALGHINNVAAGVILQEARARFTKEAGLGTLMGDLRAMAVSFTVDYAAEMHHPEPVRVETGVLDIGRTSVTIAQVASQQGLRTLYSQTVLALADRDGPAALPDALRSAYTALRIRASLE